MGDPIPRGWRIVGTALVLFFIGSASVPLILFIGGKPAFNVLIASILLFFEYAREIVGVLASAALVLLVIHLTNLRRRHP